MNVNDLTDQEKSVLLAKAMGKYENVALLAVVDALVDSVRKHYWLHNGEVQEIPDFYEVDENGDPLYMPLAWGVLNWAWRQTKTLHEKWSEEWIAKIDQVLMDYWCEGAATAMRLWLDTILELAIEASLVAEEERG